MKVFLSVCLGVLLLAGAVAAGGIVKVAESNKYCKGTPKTPEYKDFVRRDTVGGEIKVTCGCVCDGADCFKCSDESAQDGCWKCPQNSVIDKGQCTKSQGNTQIKVQFDPPAGDCKIVNSDALECTKTCTDVPECNFPNSEGGTCGELPAPTTAFDIPDAIKSTSTLVRKSTFRCEARMIGDDLKDFRVVREENGRTADGQPIYKYFCVAEVPQAKAIVDKIYLPLKCKSGYTQIPGTSKCVSEEEPCGVAPVDDASPLCGPLTLKYVNELRTAIINNPSESPLQRQCVYHCASAFKRWEECATIGNRANILEKLIAEQQKTKQAAEAKRAAEAAAKSKSKSKSKNASVEVPVVEADDEESHTEAEEPKTRGPSFGDLVISCTSEFQNLAGFLDSEMELRPKVAEGLAHVEYGIQNLLPEDYATKCIPTKLASEIVTELSTSMLSDIDLLSFAAATKDFVTMFSKVGTTSIQGPAKSCRKWAIMTFKMMERYGKISWKTREETSWDPVISRCAEACSQDLR